MKNRDNSRRNFLRQVSTLAAAAAVMPHLVHGENLSSPLVSPRVLGANEKVNLACVGIGNRGEQIIKAFAKTGLCNIVALCDIDMGAKQTQSILKMYPNVPRFQILGDGDGFISLRIFHKNLSYDFRFGFVYDIFLILDDVSERRMPACCVAFEPAFAQASVDLLLQVLGEVFVEPFDDGKEQLSFGRVGNILHCGDQLDTIVREFFSVDDRFVLVSGEPV